MVRRHSLTPSSLSGRATILGKRRLDGYSRPVQIPDARLDPETHQMNPLLHDRLNVALLTTALVGLVSGLGLLAAGNPNLAAIAWAAGVIPAGRAAAGADRRGRHPERPQSSEDRAGTSAAGLQRSRHCRPGPTATKDPVDEPTRLFRSSYGPWHRPAAPGVMRANDGLVSSSDHGSWKARSSVP